MGDPQGLGIESHEAGLGCAEYCSKQPRPGRRLSSKLFPTGNLELELRDCKTFLQKPCYRDDSLRSKSFQSTHCARVGARTKEREEGGREGDDENPPPPPLRSHFIPLFCSRPNFLDEFFAEKLATLAIVILQFSWSMKNVEDEYTKQFLKTLFEYKWSCY